MAANLGFGGVDEYLNVGQSIPRSCDDSGGCDGQGSKPYQQGLGGWGGSTARDGGPTAQALPLRARYLGAPIQPILNSRTNS